MFLIFYVFQIFHPNPGPNLGISHISHFSLFLTTIQIIQFVFVFYTFFIFHVSRHISLLPCEFLIFLICQFSCHIPVPTVGNFHFSRFLVFLAIFQVLQFAFWYFLIFHCFSSQSRSYSECFSFCMFFKFFAKFRVLIWVFLIFQVFHCFSPQSRSYSVCFSFYRFFSFFAKSRSYFLHFSYFTFSMFLSTIQILQCVLLILIVF